MFANAYGRGTLGFVPLIVAHTEALLRRWDAHRGEFERDVNDDMMDVTFGIAGEAFFGAALHAHTDTVRRSFKLALSVALTRMCRCRASQFADRAHAAWPSRGAPA